MKPMREIVLVLAVVAAFALVGEKDFESAQVTAKIADDVHVAREVSACDGATMKQWAAGEKWAPKGDDVQAECAPRAKQLPPHILTSPLGEAR